MEKTIKNLVNKYGKLYVYLADKETGEDFMRKVESEGFVFGDGAKPTEKHVSDIIAVNPDDTINYVGANGRIAFGANAGGFTRIDYKKFQSGNDDYLFSGKR